MVVGNTIYGVISFTGNPDYPHKEDVGFMDVCAYEKWVKDITNF